MDNLTISTGSGTTIATDQVGTAHYQKVKLVVGASDTATLIVMGQSSMDASLPVVIASNQSTVPVSVVAFTPGGTQNVTVVNTPTITVSTALALTVGAITTGTVSISANVTFPASGTQNVILVSGTVSTVLAMPVLSASNVSIASITAGTLNKLVLVDTVSTVSSVTTILALPVLSASNVSIASITAGTLDKVTLVSTVSTLLGTVAISGGGVHYSAGATDMGATGTGVLILGVIGTTARTLGVNTTGGLTYLDNVGNITTGTLSISAGNIAISNTPTVTISTALAFTVGNITTGTVSISGAVTVPASGTQNVIMVSGTVSTVLAMPVLSATNVTIASITTGSVSVVGGPTFYVPGAAIASGTGLGGPMFIGVQSGATLGRGLMLTTTGHQFVDTVRLLSTGVVSLSATTANVGAFVATAHGSRWDAYAVNVTSAASVILKTSGAHTLYVTDLLLSVDVPMMVTLMSAATTKLVAYFATKGGLVIDLNSPMVLNSAQSLTFQGNASGSCAAFSCGFTVT